MTQETPIDGKALQGVLRRNAFRVGWRSVLGAFLAAFGVSLTTPLAVGAVLGFALIVVGPMATGVLLRLGVVGPTLRALRPSSRRWVVLWGARALLLLSMWGWTAAPAPGINLILLPTTAGSLVGLTWLWCRWHLAREAANTPVHALERALVLAVLAIAGLALAVLVALAALLGWGVGWLLTMGGSG